MDQIVVVVVAVVVAVVVGFFVLGMSFPCLSNSAARVCTYRVCTEKRRILDLYWIIKNQWLCS